MGTCSNYKCNDYTWAKYTRCSKCRHAKNYICSECGVELNSNRAVRCKRCAKDIRALQMREIHKKSYAENKQLNKTSTVN